VWLSGKAKRKLAVAGLLAVVLAMLLIFDMPAKKTWTDAVLPLSGMVIALDPGHGGPDGGAVSRDGLVEKDVNLEISRYLRDYLQEAGALVVMTREDDRDLAGEEGPGRRKTRDLHRRVEMIRERQADLVVSIHMNSITSSRWSGAQTFYYPENHEAKNLASLIQDELKKNLENTKREINTVQTVYLLKELTMPTVLVEVGFLSNPGEARLLADPHYQKKVAACIYRGMLRYVSGEKFGSI
jgi:N-acetylmuramoyl-L-alanine amidase